METYSAFFTLNYTNFERDKKFFGKRKEMEGFLGKWLSVE